MLSAGGPIPPAESSSLLSRNPHLFRSGKDAICAQGEKIRATVNYPPLGANLDSGAIICSAKKLIFGVDKAN